MDRDRRYRLYHLNDDQAAQIIPAVFAAIDRF
jgi:hypothetical protein